MGRSDLVLEIGAGDGRLTEPLARAARRVLAAEIDEQLVAALRRRFAVAPVEILPGDALARPLPREPFRVVANVPFHATTAILRYLLDDLGAPLTRADLIVDWDVARKRAAVWPSTLLGTAWGAWHTFALTRRLAAACFTPAPRVDAGVLTIVRRPRPLIAPSDAPEFRRFVRDGFSAARLRDGLRSHLAPILLKHVAREYGFSPSAAARELDVFQWAALFRAATPVRAGSARSGGAARGGRG